MQRLTQATAVSNSDFNEVLLKSVDDAVISTLGEKVLQSLFAHLLVYRQLPRDEIPHRLNVFFPGLEKAFGPTSGKTLGRFVVKVLYSRLGLEFDRRSDQPLLDYVEHARRELRVES